MKTISVTATIKLPMMPNFLRLTDGQALDVADIADESLRLVGAAWADELIAHAAKRRAGRVTP